MQSYKSTSISTLTRWPEDTDVGFCRGIILTTFLAAALPLLEVAVVHLSGIEYVAETVGQAVIVLAVHIAGLILAGAIVSKWGHIHLMALFRLPPWKECIKWGLVGALFGMVAFFKSMNSGYRFDSLEFNLLILMALVMRSILTPFIEEVQYRAVLYVALCKKGRILAYVGSAIVFTVSHAQSYADLFFSGSMGLPTWHIIVLLLVGLVLAHIYETTGKLLICIICHAMINAMEIIGFVAGYLFDV